MRSRDRRTWMVAVAPLAIVTLAALPSSRPTAQDRVITPAENLVVAGIPAIPAAVAEEVQRYGEARSARFAAWHPIRREMLISTRFGDTDQIHAVKVSPARLRVLVAAALLAATPAASVVSSSQARTAASPRDVARWLRSVAVDTPEGRAWPGDAREPGAIDVDLGSGTAGVLLFWIQMHRADPAGGYLDDVQRGADYLVAHRRTSTEPRAPGEWTTGLYGPIAGAAFALNEAYALTGNARHRQAAIDLVDLLHQSAMRDATGASWGQAHDVLTGAAGTGLFLIYAAREMQHPASLSLAAEAGRRLIARAVPDHQGGLTWKGSYEARFVLPNFSHGAAGIGYFLAALYEATRAPEFLDAARRAATWLENVADRGDGGFRVFYGWPDPGWSRPYDIGWAHGPAGTARLFQKLWQLTGDDKWRALVRASAASLRASGLPDAPRPEYGTRFELNQRFGVAGVAAFFLDLYGVERRREDLTFAQELAAVVSAASRTDDTGTRWDSPRQPFMTRAGEPATFASYFYGAAGYGLLLLRLEAAERGKPWALRLPDEPFAARESP